ncbi:hypothetical protein XENTR_v10022540 [Xenopus tropicalis]|uniref:Selection and upkeep of intraepithelial T-cells protein 6 n=1 Tax=Xenopus tropicalis TaxID=8364 RepID=A0A803K904_XENTR|nr:hypothetical protein XENTR_v10022540 [Xenopus tropicalis]|eukprot:XP_012808968.2 PREDICTED: myelin-oligodendrocyte glycoprotein-like isoform X4 [Xenopus tropicalis]
MMVSIMYKITTVFLILQSMNEVSFSVRFKVSSTPSVSVALGSDVLLPCTLTPEKNGEKMEIRWFKPMYRPYVHLYINGKDDYTAQMPQFANRTELLKENITRGIFPLKIHKVTAEDSGEYYCYVESSDHHGMAAVQLQVTVRFKVSSTPSVSVALGSDVLLPCHLIPEMSAEKMEIRWIKPMYRPYVHLYINGKDDYTAQMPQFANRTELLKENITRGIFPLKIHKVTAQDSGEYYCHVESSDHHDKTIVQLNVTDKSLPETSRDKHRIIIIICASLTIVSFACICLLLKRLVNGKGVGFNSLSIKCEGPETEDTTTPLVMNGKVTHT